MAVITLSALLSAVISSIVSFFMAIGSPLAVEKLGGIIGGVISTMPSLIVPSSIAMILSGTPKENVYDAMLFYPSGMLINAIIWFLWKVTIPRLPKCLGNRTKLLFMLSMTTIVWLLMAVFAFIVLKEQLKIPPKWIGITSIVIHFTCGIISVIFFNCEALKGANSVKFLTHLYRGSIAGIVIFIAVLVSKVINPTIGGLIVSFPTLALSTLASVWIAQGELVINGMLSPFILASISSCVYTMLFSICLTRLSVFPSGAIAFTASVLTISAPTALFIRWISAWKSKTKGTKYHQLEEINSEYIEESKAKLKNQKSDVELN